MPPGPAWTKEYAHAKPYKILRTFKSEFAVLII